MKIPTISFAFFCIIILFSLIILPNKLFSQETTGKEFKINTGAVLSVSPIGSDHARPAIYLAPSFRNKRHEFYAGALLTFETFSPLYGSGAISGYKFYIFKEPARVNMFLHYSFIYMHKAEDIDLFDSTGKYIGPSGEKWKQDNIYNTFGIGFNTSIDKQGRFSFYSTLGYCISREKYKTQNYQNTKYNAEQINISAGFSYRFAVLKKK